MPTKNNSLFSPPRQKSNFRSIIQVLALLLILPASLKAELLYSGARTITITGSNPKATGALVIPATINDLPVTSIGTRAFDGCSGLTSVKIPHSVTSIGVSAFMRCSGLTSVTIPNSVTNIGREAFSLCSGLTSVTIPNSVTSIGRETFRWCSGLTSVTIPHSVTSIGEIAFADCSGLTSVTIPHSVISIASFAFAGLSRLTSAYFLGDAPSIGNEVFVGATNGTIYYVQGTVGWSSSYGGLPTATWFPPPPSISVQPISVTVVAGSPATLRVTATGTEQLSYQWSKEGVTIVGGTNAIFSITATTETHAGLYRVTISNSGGAVVSQTARLTVNVSPIAPAIDVHPIPVTVTAGSPAYFAVVVTGTAPLFYQWSKDGLTLPEEAYPIFSLAKATTADAGLYLVTVFNSGGTIASLAARLRVNIPGIPADNTLVLELSTNLGNPLWTPVATNYVSGSGPQRFYRLVTR